MLTLAGTGCKKQSYLSELQRAANQVVETGIPGLGLDSTNVTNATNGYYYSLPGHYSQTSKTYPLLVSIHGGGQLGTVDSDLKLVLNDGLAQTIQKKKFLPAYTVNGQSYSFIVLAPQFNGFPSSQQVEDFILYAKKHFRVDPKRVYLTGLSMGGIVTSRVAGDFASELAAAIPMSGTVNDTLVCKHIAKGKLPVWIFHNKGDVVVDVGFPISYAALINSFNPVYKPRLTLFNSSEHDAWTVPLDPTYKEEGMNIYEWMLQYSR